MYVIIKFNFTFDFTDTEKIYSEIDAEVIGRYGKLYPLTIRRKILGTSEMHTASVIVSELNLPLTAKQYHSEVKKLQKTRLENADLMPGINSKIHSFIFLYST